MEMKWLVVAGLVVSLASFGRAAVLKCTSIDPECLEKEIQDKPTSIARIEAKETELFEAECLAGSEWDSNCHSCRCSDAGVAECTKQPSCEKEMAVLEPIHCKPNSTFSRDCNTCACLQDGRGLCTLQICRPTVPTKPLPSRRRECAPESSWQSRCNQCKCTSEGVRACTDIACLGEQKEPNMDCAPNSTWIDDCNSCWCSPDGIAICTRKGCVASITMHFNDEEVVEDKKKIETDEQPLKIDLDKWILHNVSKRSVCKPSESLKHDCNICKCAADGLTYRCTQNECMDKDGEGDGVDKGVDVFMESEGVDHIERHSVCKPAGTFYIGCNTCHCNNDGTDYSCTNKPCPLPEDVELFHELKATKSSKNKTIVCVANRMFIRDCNTCWCNEDGTGYFCTRKVCIPELPDEADDKPEELRTIKRECRPDEVFELDCNMCRCNPDGKSYSCTRRACLTEPPVEVVQEVKNMSLTRMTRGIPASETPKTCTPSQEFRLDCNKCLCDNRGQDFSCTRIDCTKLNGNGGGTRRRREVGEQAMSECSPGTVFPRGCNVCRCTPDGRHATCTLKRCPTAQEEQAEKDNDVPEGDTNFRCNPGEQFRRGCNDCTCSADGKSEFCTLRVCDKDLMPRL